MKKDKVKINIMWLMVIILLWEILPRFNIVNANMLPSFTTVLVTLTDEVINGNVLFIIFNSFKMVVYGFAVALTIIIMLTILSLYSKYIRVLIDLLCTLFTPLPGVALMPVIILIFGIKEKAMIALMLHSIIWPMLTNINQGIDSMPKVYYEYGKNLQLPVYKMFGNIIFFVIMPNVICGLKVGWNRAWRALISAEMVFGLIDNCGGIGYYIYTNRAYGNMKNVMAGVFIIMIIGVITESFIFEKLVQVTIKKWGVNSEIY